MIGELIKEQSTRFAYAVLGALLAFIQPIKALCILVIAFIGVDFAVGCLAGRRRAQRAGVKWYFQSRRAWRTVEKLCCALLTIVMAYALDTYILCDATLYITKSAAGMICGWEFWSYMENAGDLSEAKFFKAIGHFAKKEIEKRTDIELPESPADETKDINNPT